MKVEKVISIIGVMNEERELDVRSVMRLTVLRSISDGQKTSFIAQLVGKENIVVARAPVMRLESRGCTCDHGSSVQHSDREPFLFQALVPDVEPGTVLRIIRQGQGDEIDTEAWSRRAPEQDPQIRRFDLRVTEGQVIAEWEAYGVGVQPLEFALQFSKDSGRSWNSLAVGIRANSYNFTSSNLPSGTIIFRLLAHDGFFTSTMEGRPIEVPKHAATVSILHPQERSPLIVGRPMRLWAAVSSATGHRINPEACRWSVDGRDVGRGMDVWVTVPAEGQHRCMLIVEDEGEWSEVSTTFTTVELHTSSRTPLAESNNTKKMSTRRSRK